MVGRHNGQRSELGLVIPRLFNLGPLYMFLVETSMLLEKKNKNNNNFFATLCIFCFICLSKDFGICFRITLHVKSRKIFYAYSAHLFFHLFIQRFRILLPDNPSRQIKENIVCLFCVSLLFLLSIQRFQICFRITLYVKSRRISYGLYI